MVKEYKRKINEDGSDNNSTSILSLTQYLDNIGKVISTYCGYSQWVRCEVIKVSNSGGHYYLEISDSDQNGRKIKSQTAIIFSSKSFEIVEKFQNHTRMNISAGMNILLLLKVDFKPNFGLSFIVQNIDPSYTLGEIERKNNLIKEEIFNRGWNNLNKQKKLPLHFKNIAVLSPKGAAGLGDFKSEADKMQRYGICNFNYFDAKFEGDDVIESITLKMKEIYDSGIDRYDALVFIRGGGSVSSLQSLNEFKIVSYVAKYPIPVIVGVGHERDHVLVDDFARLKLDTPSKVAEFIFNNNQQNLINADKNISFVFNYLENSVGNLKNNISNNTEYIKQASFSYIENLVSKINYSFQAISNSLDGEINNKIFSISKNYSEIMRGVDYFISNIENSIKINIQNVFDYSEGIIENKISMVKNNFEFIESSSYQSVINKGYAIIIQDEKILTSKEDFCYNKETKIKFHDGIIKTIDKGE